MRKVINKKVYDTKTAELVAEYYNGYSQRDFRYLYEGLYRTRKDQFFVHGDGGAMMKYGERVGNQTSGTETIILLTTEEAYEWLAEHNELAAIEKHFSNVIQEG